MTREFQQPVDEDDPDENDPLENPPSANEGSRMVRCRNCGMATPGDSTRCERCNGPVRA